MNGLNGPARREAVFPATVRTLRVPQIILGACDSRIHSRYWREWREHLNGRGGKIDASFPRTVRELFSENELYCLFNYYISRRKSCVRQGEECEDVVVHERGAAYLCSVERRNNRRDVVSCRARVGINAKRHERHRVPLVIRHT